MIRRDALGEKGVFGEPHREQTAGMLYGDNLPVAGVTADPVKGFAGVQIPLGECHYLSYGSLQRRHSGLTVKYRLGNCDRRLEVYEVPRSIEQVPRSFSHLEIPKVMLHKVWTVAPSDNEYSPAEVTPECVVDHPFLPENRAEVIKCILHRCLHPMHPRPVGDQTCGVGDACVFNVHLRAIGEGRGHRKARLLADCEFLDGLRCRMYIHKTLAVHGRHDLQTDAAHIIDQTDHHSRLVAIAARVHDPLPIGNPLQHQAHRRIGLEVDGNDVLPGFESFLGDNSSVLHGTCGFHDDIDRWKGAQNLMSGAYSAPTLINRTREYRGIGTDHDICRRATRGGIRVNGSSWCSVNEQSGTHSRGDIELIGKSPTDEAGANDCYVDDIAGLLPVPKPAKQRHPGLLSPQSLFPTIRLASRPPKTDLPEYPRRIVRTPDAAWTQRCTNRRKERERARIVKAVVLSGGSGTRLRPLTYSTAKQLVPVAGQPTLFYGLRDLVAAGVEDVIIVISPETGDQVRLAVGDGSGLGINPTFVVQPEPNGLAAALALALPLVGQEDCVMVLGDVLARQGIPRAIEDFDAGGASCQLLVAEVERPEAFGIVELDASGSIRRLVEKPLKPLSNLAIVGVYVFDGHIAEAVHAIPPSARGEYEITDAIQHLLETGKVVRPSRTPSWWKDTGRKEDLLEANRLVLAELDAHVEGELVDCSLASPVVVGRGSRLVDCTLRGPVVIGESVRASGSILGPNASIGDDCQLMNATIEDSILMEKVSVSHWKVNFGLIGPESTISEPAPSDFAALTLGQRSSIGPTPS